MEDTSINEIHALLSEQNAIIVHFSTVPKMSGLDISYPEDLNTAIQLVESETAEIPCSVIKPGDQWQSGKNKRKQQKKHKKQKRGKS